MPNQYELSATPKKTEMKKKKTKKENKIASSIWNLTWKNIWCSPPWDLCHAFVYVGDFLSKMIETKKRKTLFFHTIINT